MKYTVTWLPVATSELAEIWLSAPDRQAVTLAADRIDHVLATGPLDHGESREEDTRVLLIEPLGVEYEVGEDDRTVQVNAAWHMK